MKTDERIAAQIIERTKARKAAIRRLKYEIDLKMYELEKVRNSDRSIDLAKEFGIGKSTIDRMVSKL